MGAANRLFTCLGKSEVLHFPLLDQVFHCACNLLDRHVGIDAVLVVEVNRIDSQPRERAFDNLLDVLGPAIQSAPSFPITRSRRPAELGCDHYLPSEGSQGRPHKLLID